MVEVLRVENLAVTYRSPEGPVEAVRDVSFRVRPGRTTALVGESGSGKSACAQAIMGLLPAAGRITGGRILFRDWHKPREGAAPEPAEPVDLASLPPNGRTMRRLRGGRMAMVFQEPMTALSPVHRIGDQIGEAARLHLGMSRSEAAALAVETLKLARFPEPELALQRYPFELSGGLRQRAVIAMALVCNPSLLIADEPTTALDVTLQAQIVKLFKQLQNDLEMGLLLITHDLGVVANLADEVSVLYRGRVMESGDVRTVVADPGHAYAQALQRAMPRFDDARLQPLRSIAVRVPAPAAQSAATPATTVPFGAPLLEAEGLTKTYTHRSGGLFGIGATRALQPAVRDVSFTVARGECLGLVGESGCGKTTLSKILMRGLEPDSGRLTWHSGQGDIDMLQLKGRALTEFRPHLQFIFQDPFSSLNPRMSVSELIGEPLLLHGRGDKAHRTELVVEAMERVGLDATMLRRYPHSFSGGQRQRIGIARALALQPDMLICDEPVSALDVSVQAQILNLLKDLQSAFHLTYLFITHNMAVVHYMADRIMVMSRGQMVELAPKTALFGDARHPYTRALIEAVPHADFDRPLDFTAIGDESARNPASWPEAFRSDETGALPPWREVAPQHFVRMR